MSHEREIPHEAALRELIEEAHRSGESRSAPRRHHLVPVFYLKHWADDGKIRVTDIDKRKSWITTPKRAASENDYYRIESPDLDPEDEPPLLFEVTLSRIERWGADFIAALLDDPVGALRDDQMRVLFSYYMAFQYVRGRDYRAFTRASMTDLFKLSYGEITDKGIRHELSERGLETSPENRELFRKFVDQLNSGEIMVGPHQASDIWDVGPACPGDRSVSVRPRLAHLPGAENIIDLRRAGNSDCRPASPPSRTRRRRRRSGRDISTNTGATAGYVRRLKRETGPAIRTGAAGYRSTKS